MKYHKKVLLLLAAVSLVRVLYIIYTPFGLSPDEAHYWEWSRRLGLSYYSKGPFVAYTIAFFTAIFGQTEFGVRAGAVLFSAGASYILYLLGTELSGSERTGFYAAGVSLIIPLFSVGSILMTTDVLFVFFWAAACLSIIQALKTQNSRWWYLTGLITGMGFLSKYTMVLIYPTLFLFLLFSRKDRPWLKRPAPYLACLISLAVASPVVIWNVLNGWVTVRHTLGQAHVSSPSFSIAEPLDFLLSQFGLITPIIFLILVYGIWRCAAAGFREGKNLHLFSFFASAFIFLFFLLKGFHGKVQANWAVAAYATAIPAGVWALEEAYKGGLRKGKKLLTVILIAGAAIGAAGTAVAYCPWLLEPLGAKKILWGPPFNRVTAWTELGQKVSDVKEEMDRTGKTFIMSDTYQITSELAFYTRDNPVTYNVNTGSRRMNQYDLWPGFEGLKGFNAIYVKGGVAVVGPMVQGAFDRCVKELFPVYYKGRLLKTFSIFRCFNFNGLEKRHDDERY